MRPMEAQSLETGGVVVSISVPDRLVANLKARILLAGGTEALARAILDRIQLLLNAEAASVASAAYSIFVGQPNQIDQKIAIVNEYGTREGEELIALDKAGLLVADVVDHLRNTRGISSEE